MCRQLRLFGLLSQVESFEQDALTTVAVLRRQIESTPNPLQLTVFHSSRSRWQLPTLMSAISLLRPKLSTVGVQRFFRFQNLWSDIQYGNGENMLIMLQ
jgi:hypothetical protein